MKREFEDMTEEDSLDDVYGSENEMLDDDMISPEEEGFMKGYNEDATV